MCELLLLVPGFVIQGFDDALLSLYRGADELCLSLRDMPWLVKQKIPAQLHWKPLDLLGLCSSVQWMPLLCTASSEELWLHSACVLTGEEKRSPVRAVGMAKRSCFVFELPLGAGLSHKETALAALFGCTGCPEVGTEILYPSMLCLLCKWT